MYNLPNYKEHDESVVLEFMKAHPFAVLIGCADGIPQATQIPLLFEERGKQLVLAGHVMRKQDHQLAYETNPEVLVLFTGAHTYVSGSWYADPHQASTWNYMSVHARGQLRFLDEKGLVDVLKKLSLHFENNNTDSPTIYDNLPPDYLHRLMKSIVAFEIEVRSIEHVFKLSQNRDKESYHNIIPRLKGQGGDASEIATIMEKRSSQLFKD